MHDPVIWTLAIPAVSFRRELPRVVAFVGGGSSGGTKASSTSILSTLLPYKLRASHTPTRSGLCSAAILIADVSCSTAWRSSFVRSRPWEQDRTSRSSGGAGVVDSGVEGRGAPPPCAGAGPARLLG